MFGGKYWGASYWGASYWGDVSRIFVSFGLRVADPNRSAIAPLPVYSASADMITGAVAARPRVGEVAAEPQKGHRAPGL